MRQHVIRNIYQRISHLFSSLSPHSRMMRFYERTLVGSAAAEPEAALNSLELHAYLCETSFVITN